MTTLEPQNFDESRLVALLQAYLRARYRWQYRDDWHDIVVGLPTPGLDLRYPQVPSFGMLSAFNPLSVRKSGSENRRADRRLETRLEEIGLPYIPAFASAEDRSWREPGWIIFGIGADAFDALGREFGQLGTLWWRAGAPVRLRIDAARPCGIEGDQHIDWLR